MTYLHPSTEDLGIGARGRIAEHAQIELIFVRECSHRQTLISDEGQDWKGFDKPGAEGIERYRRTRNICHDQIERGLVVQGYRLPWPTASPPSWTGWAVVSPRKDLGPELEGPLGLRDQTIDAVQWMQTVSAVPKRGDRDESHPKSPSRPQFAPNPSALTESVLHGRDSLHARRHSTGSGAGHAARQGLTRVLIRLASGLLTYLHDFL